MNKLKKEEDSSIFGKDNPFAQVLVATFEARSLSSDPLNNEIVTEAINRSMGLTDSRFAQCVRISAEPISSEDEEEEESENMAQYVENFEQSEPEYVDMADDESDEAFEEEEDEEDEAKESADTLVP